MGRSSRSERRRAVLASEERFINVNRQILGGIYLQLSRPYGLHAWRSYFSLAVRF